LARHGRSVDQQIAAGARRKPLVPVLELSVDRLGNCAAIALRAFLTSDYNEIMR